MNWDFIRTYAPEYMKAARLTVHIGLAGICFSLLIGMIAAVVLHFRIRVLSRLFSCYIELSRNHCWPGSVFRIRKSLSPGSFPEDRSKEWLSFGHCDAP